MAARLCDPVIAGRTSPTDQLSGQRSRAWPGLASVPLPKCANEQSAATPPLPPPLPPPIVRYAYARKYASTRTHARARKYRSVSKCRARCEVLITADERLAAVSRRHQHTQTHCPCVCVIHGVCGVCVWNVCNKYAATRSNTNDRTTVPSPFIAYRSDARVRASHAIISPRSGEARAFTPQNAAAIAATSCASRFGDRITHTRTRTHTGGSA